MKKATEKKVDVMKDARIKANKARRIARAKRQQELAAARNLLRGETRRKRRIDKQRAYADRRAEAVVG
jgi:hypothetical protein